jgi:hypothetical protein
MKKPLVAAVLFPLGVLLGASFVSAGSTNAVPVTAATKSKTAVKVKPTAKPRSKPASKPTSKTSSKATTKPTTSTPATTAKPSTEGLTRVPLEAGSDTYFVLFARPVAGSDWELPVAIAKGGTTATTLSDGRKQLPAGRLRVESFPIAKPGDVDADGIDDLTELNGQPALNPLSAVATLDQVDAVAIVPDRATFEKLSYQGNDVARDSYLAGLEYVKFFITKSDTPRPLVYVMNTETWRAHPMFAQAVGISSGRGRGSPGEMRGDVTYYPKAIGPDGTPGLYRFAFQPNDSYSFAEISVAFEVIANQMPFLAPKLAYFPHQGGLAYYEQEKKLYSASRVPVVVEAQLIGG